MNNNKEKIEASILLASYLETVGFKNGHWEFNYQIKITDLQTYIRVWNTMLHHFLILGGTENINIENWNSSDDTIMIMATLEAIINGGGLENYEKKYLEYYDLILDEKRASGSTTISSLEMLKRKKELKVDVLMGGNGAAMRTGPIGLKWYKDYDKVIEESLIASKITHNYYIGYFGGIVTALFTAFAMNNIEPWLWCDELLKLYSSKKLDKDNDLDELDDYMSYWKKYKEVRISKLKYKNTLKDFIFPEDRATFLLGFHPNSNIQKMIHEGKIKEMKDLKFSWNHSGSTGIDACIYAYDCLLMCMNTPSSDTLDFKNIVYDWSTFMMLVCLHPGDNDTTGCIGGTWYGALNGFNNIDKSKMKQLEFYSELEKLIKKI